MTALYGKTNHMLFMLDNTSCTNFARQRHKQSKTSTKFEFEPQTIWSILTETFLERSVTAESKTQKNTWNTQLNSKIQHFNLINTIKLYFNSLNYSKYEDFPEQVWQFLLDGANSFWGANSSWIGQSHATDIDMSNSSVPSSIAHYRSPPEPSQLYSSFRYNFFCSNALSKHVNKMIKYWA